MKFFSMEAFVHDQDSLLTLKNGFLKKILTDQNRKEERTIEDPKWAAELEILLEYELDKNVNQGEYVKDSSEGMLVYSLRAENTRLDIKEQKVLYSGSGDVKAIYTLKERKNWLYRSRSTLEVNLGPRQMIRSYKLNFDKKVILLDPEQYSIEVIFQ